MGFVRTENLHSLMVDRLVHLTYGHHNGTVHKRLKACGGYDECVVAETPQGLTCFFCLQGLRAQ